MESRTCHDCTLSRISITLRDYHFVGTFKIYAFNNTQWGQIVERVKYIYGI